MSPRTKDGGTLTPPDYLQSVVVYSLKEDRWFWDRFHGPEWMEMAAAREREARRLRNRIPAALRRIRVRLALTWRVLRTGETEEGFDWDD